DEVHRAASPVRGAGLLAEELGHYRLGIHTTRDRVAVLAVAREDPVVRFEREDAADDRGLLADVEVAVPADLRLRVLLLRALLEAADELHLAVHAEQKLAIVLGQLEDFGVDRAGRGGWGGGLDGGRHLLSSILHVRGGCAHLPTLWGGPAACGGVGVHLPTLWGGPAACGGGGETRPPFSGVYRTSLRGQRGLHQGFGQGRVSVDGEVDLLQRQPVLHRQRRLRDQVGGARPDDVRAQKLARPRVGHDLHKTVALAQGQRATRGGERKAADLDRDPFFLRLFLAQPDVGDLGVGVNAVGRGVIVGDAV